MITISIGSNLGNRFSHLRQAVSLLKERYLKNMQCSIVLETDCILPPGAPVAWDKPFLNMVVAGQCDCSPDQLLQGLKQIECEIGRPEAYERWSPRVIDLDILLWDDVTLDTPHLKIPHPEIDNRPFLIHLLAMMGSYKIPQIPKNCFTRSYLLSPRFVGIVNVTADSFSDGGLCEAPDKAITQAINHMTNGAIVELGAQSTTYGAVMQGPEAEYAKLKPVLDGLKSFMQSGEMTVSIDTFLPQVIDRILGEYPIAWINDVKGTLDDETLKSIALRKCNICIMHSLEIPAHKEIIIPLHEPPIAIIKDWASKTIERLLVLGFSLDSIIIDPGIGFGKSAYQSINILHHLEALKTLDVQVLIGHSRKSYMGAFTPQEAKDRDIETLAVSSLIADKADFLRIHNVDDHMRFFTAQHAIQGGMYEP